MTSQHHFDCTVRCEVAVPTRPGRAHAAEAAFQDCGWPFRELAPGRYTVDVVVMGSRTGAGTRARRELLGELRRRGVDIRLIGVARLNVEDQQGDLLPVHEVRASRLPGLERLLVALGLRDTGDMIQASYTAQADHRLMLLVSSLENQEPLAWRRRLGRMRLPRAESPPRRATTRPVVAVLVTVFTLGLVAGIFSFPLAVPVPLVLLVLPALIAIGLGSGWFLVRAQGGPEWAVLPLLLPAAGYVAGASTGRALWWAWPVAACTVLGGIGLRHLVRDLSLVEQIPWLLPAILPLIVPLTAYVGDLAYRRYLGAVGLSREDVLLGLWDRLAAAAAPVGIAVAASLAVLAVWGWLRYLHFEMPVVTSLLVSLAYLASGVSAAAHQGSEAGKHPAMGFFALRPEWVCVSGVEDKIPTRGAALPVPPRPLLALELTNNQLALWDLDLGPERGLIKVRADKVGLLRVKPEST